MGNDAYSRAAAASFSSLSANFPLTASSSSWRALRTGTTSHIAVWQRWPGTRVAPWCGPCRIVAPAVERLSEELAGKLKVVKLNTDDEPALGQRFGVRSIPTLLLMDGGKERDRVVGALNVNALRNWVQERLLSSAAKPQA